MQIAETSALSRPLGLWAAVLGGGSVLFSPFYLYASGLPQPGHVVMMLSALAILALNRTDLWKMVQQNRYAAAFMAVVVLVNAVYGLHYWDADFLISTIYWAYGFILLAAVLCVGRDPLFGRWISGLIVIKMVMIALAYLAGFGYYTWWPRYEYYFNGPNQLAYFAICMLLVFVAVNRGRFSVWFYLVYGLTVFTVISTGGRSAYLALLPLVLLFFFMARRQWTHLVLLVVILLAASACFQPLCLPNYMPGTQGNVRVGCDSPVDATKPRIVSSATFGRLTELSINNDVADNSSVRIQLLARGYTRVYQYPQYLLYGAGQGRDDRFANIDGYVYEIHSSIVAVWFYYGFLGLLLFAKFIYDLFKVKANLVFLLPVFTYGLFTYGLRSPYFWIALGFLAVMPPVLGVNDEVADV